MYCNFNLYFKNTTKYPNSPYFNITTFSEYLNINNVAKRVNLNYKLFIHEINELNLFYKKTYSQTIIPIFKGNVMKHINKLNDINPYNPCFLSLYKKFEWVERILHKIQTGGNYSTMIHYDTINCRKPIGSRIKSSVWKKRFNTIENQHCDICSNIFCWETFHCGHIQSIFYGGKTDVSNLEPICQQCNLNMGIQNLHDYKIKYQLEQNINNDI
jgi:hypothetical protein